MSEVGQDEGDLGIWGSPSASGDNKGSGDCGKCGNPLHKLQTAYCHLQFNHMTPVSLATYPFIFAPITHLLLHSDSSICLPSYLLINLPTHSPVHIQSIY